MPPTTAASASHRRSARLHCKYLYRKSLASSKSSTYKDKCRIRDALSQGRELPTELRATYSCLWTRHTSHVTTSQNCRRSHLHIRSCIMRRNWSIMIPLWTCLPPTSLHGKIKILLNQTYDLRITILGFVSRHYQKPWPTICSRCRLPWALFNGSLVLLDMYCVRVRILHIASRESGEEWEFIFPVLSFEFSQFPKVKSRENSSLIIYDLITHINPFAAV